MKVSIASSDSLKMKKRLLKKKKKLKKRKPVEVDEDSSAATTPPFEEDSQSKKKVKKLKRKHSPENIRDLPASSATPEKAATKSKKKKFEKLKKHTAEVSAETNGAAPSDSHTEDRSFSDEVENDAEESETSEVENDAEESETSDLFNEGTGQELNFDIEAFPMEAGDKDGIVNMLTQIFLRADIDLASLADAVIAQSPFGIVIGPAEDQSDEDSENDVYGVLTIAELLSPKVELPKYAEDVMKFLENKSKKFALQNFRGTFEAAKTKRIGLFINERMLNFPTQIVSPSFSSFRSDYERLQKKYNSVIYVHKLRIADAGPSSLAEKEDSGEPVKKKKKKLGKAEKKRLVRKTLLSAETIYDNVEDELLTQLEEGEAHFFDYPVHTEIESSSKFHTVIKDGKSFKPYRRIVLMDSKRFKAFLESASTSF